MKRRGRLKSGAKGEMRRTRNDPEFKRTADLAE
jgi:hypothetical protein